MTIRIADSDADILACFDVMSQLRPHLVRDDFVGRVHRMQEEGFHLAFVEDGGEVRGVAGYRCLDLLFSGRTLYVDDLVTDASRRSRGYGAALHDWLLAEARRRSCATLTLDSGVHRTEAHRFYFRQRMHIAGYHFSMPVEGG